MAVKQNDKLKALQAALKANKEVGHMFGKLTIPQTKELEQVIADTIFELAKKDKVKFADLGDFEIREQAARKGINPAKLKELKAQGVDEETAKAEASIDVAASQKLAFGQSSTIKAELKA